MMVEKSSTSTLLKDENTGLDNFISTLLHGRGVPAQINREGALRSFPFFTLAAYGFISFMVRTLYPSFFIACSVLSRLFWVSKSALRCAADGE